MEFGSDFHSVKDYPKGKSGILSSNQYQLYTDGRQALETILRIENIRRLWAPSYYCHESLSGLNRLGIEINFYPCTPTDNPDKVIEDMDFSEGEALLRMNYFGLYSKPQMPHGASLVIEDHSHSLSGSWAKESGADWCFASLRKTLPIADGGILWSPIGRLLPPAPILSPPAVNNASIRYDAMDMKSDYLKGLNVDKEEFLSKFHQTEDFFEKLEISAISNPSKEIVESIDIDRWNRRKSHNWEVLRESLIPSTDYRILLPENSMEIPFSMVLLFRTSTLRDKILRKLIKLNVFPAVLWQIPKGNDTLSIEFGKRMLSIHCDGRYTPGQIVEMANRINKCIEDDQNNQD